MNPDLISNSQILLVRNLAAVHAAARYRKHSTFRDQRVKRGVTHAHAERNIASNFLQDRRNSGGRSLAFFVAFAAELLELGKYGADVEFAGLFFGFRSGGHLGLLARGGFGGREKCRTSVRRRGLLLVGARDFEIEIDLRSKSERDWIHWRQIGGIPM